MMPLLRVVGWASGLRGEVELGEPSSAEETVGWGAEVVASGGVEPGQTIVASVADSALSPAAEAGCLAPGEPTPREAGTRPELASCVEEASLKESARAAEIASCTESASVAECTRASVSAVFIVLRSSDESGSTCENSESVDSGFTLHTYLQTSPACGKDAGVAA